MIIGQYRTVIKKSVYMDEEQKQQALKTVTRAASVAAFFAILVVFAVAIPLAIVGGKLNEDVVAVIEGISKVVAAFCIIQLSIKIPVWLNIYKKVSLFDCSGSKYDPNKKKNVDMLTNEEIYFNVAWNIWREVAECGVFLIPFFLDTNNLKAIPLSAVIGSLISLVLGIGVYIANNRLKTKTWLAVLMSGLTFYLSVGLFVGGCHEFEEVWGDTKNVWSIENEFWSDNNFPMVLLKPFGWSSSRSVLQITTFWCWTAFGLSLHYIKWRNSQVVRGLYPDEEVKKISESDEDEEYASREDVEVGADVPESS